MRKLFETAFGPTELGIVETVLTEWLEASGVSRDMPEAELAAAIVITLFRDGNDSAEKLKSATLAHKGLEDLRRLSLNGQKMSSRTL